MTTSRNIAKILVRHARRDGVQFYSAGPRAIAFNADTAERSEYHSEKIREAVGLNVVSLADLANEARYGGSLDDRARYLLATRERI